MKGYYINLDNRIDRREHIEKNILSIPFFRDINRFSAIQKDDGHHGCAISHLCCLEKIKNDFKNEDEKTFMILEDDFFIFNNENFNDFLKAYEELNDEWDVLILTPKGKIDIRYKDKNFIRILGSSSCTGYIIKYDFIEKLIECFKKCVFAFENHKPIPIDQAWKKLQERYTFLYFNKLYAGQIPSYSDIEKRKTNYIGAYKLQTYYQGGKRKILSLLGREPLFGHPQVPTHWLCWMKIP